MKRSFAADIEKFKRNTKRKIEVMVEQVAANLVNEIQLGGEPAMYPVETGWARASFFVTVNEPHRGTYGERPDVKAGDSVIDPPPAVKIPKIKLGDRVIITNNVPYAKFIENGKGGHASHQGIVKACMQRAVRAIDKIARSMNK